jgi:hypothetical protein
VVSNALLRSDRIDHYIRSNHRARVNRKITAVGGDITVTESGLAAAIHKEGPGGVREYLRWLEGHGLNSRDQQNAMPAGSAGSRSSSSLISLADRAIGRIAHNIAPVPVLPRDPHISIFMVN